MKGFEKFFYCFLRDISACHGGCAPVTVTLPCLYKGRMSLLLCCFGDQDWGLPEFQMHENITL